MLHAANLPAEMLHEFSKVQLPSLKALLDQYLARLFELIVNKSQNIAPVDVELVRLQSRLHAIRLVPNSNTSDAPLAHH